MTRSESLATSESNNGFPVTARNVDLTNCDREQIHTPGAVQPHGVLLVVEESDMTVRQVSANSFEILGIAPADLLGRPLTELMDAAEFRYWEQQMLMKRLDGNPLYLVPMPLKHSSKTFESTVHRHDGVLQIQIEEHGIAEQNKTLDLYASARCILTDLQRTSSLADFYCMAAQGVREHTNYDRVVVYQFLEDGSGEVVGESKREDLPSWLGLRYPASDIPKQARELYLRSWIRIITDVAAVPSPMVPLLNPVTQKPLDMSFCVLRSVSPVHIQYMTNIGAQASMSLSLIKDDRLWGLIACHHQTPKRVSHAARIACELLAHSVSLQIGSKESTDHLEYFAELRERVAQLVESMANGNLSTAQGLSHFKRLSGLFRSTGACVVSAEDVFLTGEAPSADQVQAMLPWLTEQPLQNGLFVTHRLPEVYPPAAGFKEQASGLLALRVQDTKLQWLLWFRPEVIQSVKWAGNPAKPVNIDSESGELRLSPRRSFALWQGEKRATSEPWWPGEILIAEELRHALVEVVLRHAEQLQQLNRDLNRSNRELESFAYVASHDLKEPLRGIHNYSHMLLRSLAPKLNAVETERFQMVLRLSQRMDDLIESLLQYSRVGQMELNTEKVPLDNLVQQLLKMMKPRLDEAAVAVRIPRSLPAVNGDRVLLHEVFQNLFVNAVKYNDKPLKWVEVGFQEQSPTVFYVRDNGIGIDPRHHQTIFRIFKRLHTADQFGGGTGAGLTITQRIVERHGGRMWLTSEPGEGTTFYFTLDGG